MTTILDYPFRGVPLSPTACLQVVTTWVLDAEPLSRQDIFDRVLATRGDRATGWLTVDARGRVA